MKNIFIVAFVLPLFSSCSIGMIGNLSKIGGIVKSPISTVGNIVFNGNASVSSAVSGGIYKNIQLGSVASDAVIGKKVGTGKATSILGLIATGDVSIEKASKMANISKISHVDYKAKSILGLYASYTVFVYGE